MNRNILFLSIAACFASFPSYASNIENNLEMNASNNTFSEAEYKKKLEEFLMDDTPEGKASEKEVAGELNNINESEVTENSIVSVKKETKSKDTDTPKVNEEASSETENVNGGLNMIKMSSLQSDINNLSLLLKGEVGALKEKTESYDESLNVLKNETSENIEDLRIALNEELSSKVGQDTIENLKKELSELNAFVDEGFEGFYSKEVIDEKVSQLKSNIQELVAEIQGMEPILTEAVQSSEYQDYKKAIEEEFKILKEELVKKAELNEDLMSLKNKIEGNSLSLKEKSDVIRDVKKVVEQRVEDVVKQIQSQEQVLNNRLSALENKETGKESSKDVKQLLDEKDSVIDEQNKKIEELNEKYNALIKQVAELKESGFNNNVIKVENLANLKEAEKKVQEDGGVLILDKNGQLKVLN
jgi:DNA repair exonuclease SbcCD ATPase subunit